MKEDCQVTRLLCRGDQKLIFGADAVQFRINQLYEIAVRAVGITCQQQQPSQQSQLSILRSASSGSVNIPQLFGYLEKHWW